MAQNSCRDFEGKTVIVTGSARGIGMATAQLFAEAGANVIVSDILVEEGAATADLIREKGGEAVFQACDTADESQIKALMKAAISRYGALDCLVNNAAIEGDIAPIVEYDMAKFDRMISVNLRGVWLCMKYAIQHMLERGQGGAIVNMASLAGHVGMAGIGGYVTSKHGVLGMTKVAAIEYSKHGIRTNAVSPGCIQTEMIDKLSDAMGAPSAEAALGPQHPIGRLGRPEEIAEAVLWLCSDKASNVTGTSLNVDGGWTIQ